MYKTKKNTTYIFMSKNKKDFNDSLSFSPRNLCSFSLKIRSASRFNGMYSSK